VTIAAGLIAGFDEPGERITHRHKLVDALLQPGDPGGGQQPGLLAWCGAALGEVQELLGVVEAESEILGPLDKAHHSHRVDRVSTVTGFGALGFSQQTAAFVVPQGFYVDLRLRGYLARSHLISMNPVPGYGVKSSGRSHRCGTSRDAATVSRGFGGESMSVQARRQVGCTFRRCPPIRLTHDPEAGRWPGTLQWSASGSCDQSARTRTLPAVCPRRKKTATVRRQRLQALGTENLSTTG